jgi:integrase
MTWLISRTPRSDLCKVWGIGVGADVRIIQQIRGHVELSTTEIYTRVSIRLAKKVHEMGTRGRG